MSVRKIDSAQLVALYRRQARQFSVLARRFRFMVGDESTAHKFAMLASGARIEMQKEVAQYGAQQKKR